MKYARPSCKTGIPVSITKQTEHSASKHRDCCSFSRQIKTCTSIQIWNDVWIVKDATATNRGSAGTVRNVREEQQSIPFHASLWSQNTQSNQPAQGNENHQAIIVCVTHFHHFILKQGPVGVNWLGSIDMSTVIPLKINLFEKCICSVNRSAFNG